ncbi:hypothetical protein ANN_27582 [Periplaneta americana]|uniref:Reverse transcriptase domain-containing protein n=1 Tax=Periplaneta americana TaxID=6978 RepID=A0ABQ8RW98_PERAM|nr:hypothetical protein ANN_27582 [Periplaneta americana]
MTKHQLLALFIDISQAYDSINLRILASQLKAYCIPSTLITTILALMYNPKLQLTDKVQNNSCRTTSQGLPQGSVLSPLLYTLWETLNDNSNHHYKFYNTLTTSFCTNSYQANIITNRSGPLKMKANESSSIYKTWGWQ